jgi:hypothetical protein
MKRITQGLIVGFCAALLSPTAAEAASVNFIEGPTEGNPVNVTFSPPNSASSIEWFGSLPPTTTAGTESATFTGYMSGQFGTGGFEVVLREPSTGAVSDWLTVNWSLVSVAGFGNFTQFTMNFQSDVEGGPPLQPPAGYQTATALEDGSLQLFTVPATFPLTVGIQSDVEVVPEPSVGALLLLPIGVSALRRMRNVKSLAP